MVAVVLVLVRPAPLQVPAPGQADGSSNDSARQSQTLAHVDTAYKRTSRP